MHVLFSDVTEYLQELKADIPTYPLAADRVIARVAVRRGIDPSLGLPHFTLMAGVVLYGTLVILDCPLRQEMSPDHAATEANAAVRRLSAALAELGLTVRSGCFRP